MGKVAIALLSAPLWYVASVIIGQLALLILGVDHSTLDAFITGSITLIVLILVLRQREKGRGENERREREARFCSHGVPGGITANKCQTCIAERQAEEAAREQAKALAEKRRLIQHEYTQLRESEKIRLRDSVIPSVAEFQALSSQQFEDAIAELYKRLGYSVQQTPYSNDGGRDAILELDGNKYLLECKRYADTNLVGRPEIQKFHSAVIMDGAIGGFFVSTSAFTKEAAEYAAKIEMVTLIKGTDLQELVFNSGNASTNDYYETLCLDCGGRVRHRLRTSVDQQCDSGHAVKPSLSIADVIARTPGKPICQKCGAFMRVVNGRHGKFLGCSRYPVCRSTQQHGRNKRRWNR